MRWFWRHRNKFCRTYDGCWTNIKVLSLSPSPHTLFCFFARLLLKMHNYYWWKVRLHFTHNASQKVPPIPSPLSRNLLVVVWVKGMWLLCDHCFLDLVCLTCNCSNVLVVANGEVKNPQDNNRKISINFFKNHSFFFFFLFPFFCCFYFFCYKFLILDYTWLRIILDKMHQHILNFHLVALTFSAVQLEPVFFLTTNRRRGIWI